MDQSVQQSSHVFTNELLVEIIMKHVVTSGDIHLIQACRLVAWNWCLGVTTAAKKLKLPLYRLRLDESNSLEGTPYVRANGKLLDQFHQQTDGDSNVENVIEILPLKISAAKEFFNIRNILQLLDCMQQCCTNLVELDINLGAVNLPPPLRCKFPDRILPKLRRLNVHFNDSIPRGGNQAHQYSVNVVYNKLLSVIFRASNNLVQLVISDGKRSTLCGPFHFFNLPLPSTIKHLDLRCSLREADMNAIRSNSFPNLKVLHLEISYVSFNMNDITIFLQTVSQSIVELTLIDRSRRQLDPPNIVHIPLLPQLQLFISERTQIEISTHNGARLEQKLPMVSRMIWKNLSAQVLSRLTEATRFESVESLTVSSASRTRILLPYSELSIGEDMVGRLRSSFPNIRSLDIRFHGDDVSGIRRIFRTMQNLEELVIRARGQDSVTSGYRWDSIFIGVHEKDIFKLRTNPNLLESLQGNGDGQFASITKLTRLRSLSLLSEVHDPESKRQQYSLITYLVFTHALLKMPNLVKLKTAGRFKVRKEMILKWKESGRSIETGPQEPMEQPYDDQ